MLTLPQFQSVFYINTRSTTPRCNVPGNKYLFPLLSPRKVAASSLDLAEIRTCSTTGAWSRTSRFIEEQGGSRVLTRGEKADCEHE